MKNILAVFILGVFLLSGLGVATTSGTTIGRGMLPATDYTHTVLAEEATSTDCGYCPIAARQMHEIYTSGEHDFYYVTLVANKNTYAHGRINELQVPGYPTIVFDGGYRRIVGAQSSTTPYKNALDYCGVRTVANLDITPVITWDGTAKVGVTVDVKNNEGETYVGHLHVYITEINSRWWNQGTQYHFAMVGDYALNQDVQINAGDTFHQVVVWDGSAYGMSDIAQNNVMVIASVFAAGSKYVDETAAASFDPGENHPPNTPTITGEINGSVRTSYDYTITATDPDTDDVKYIIDWGDDTSTTTGFNESGEEVTVSHTWNRKGTYTVRVKAIDEEDAESEWGTLIVTMPMTASYERWYHFFEGFFERFPNAFPLLRLFLGF